MQLRAARMSDSKAAVGKEKTSNFGLEIILFYILESKMVVGFIFVDL